MLLNEFIIGKGMSQKVIGIYYYFSYIMELVWIFVISLQMLLLLEILRFLENRDIIVFVYYYLRCYYQDFIIDDII